MKIAIILDHKLNNDLSNPTDKQLRNLGHSITDLYAAVTKSANQMSVNDGWFSTDSIQAEVLSALSEFARASRYYNIDQLVGGQESPDPLSRWFETHMQIAEDAISYRRRSEIMQRAQAFCEARGLLDWEWGPKGRYDLTIDVNYQLSVARVSRGQCVWCIIKILKPIYHYIDRLIEKIHHLEVQKGIENPTVPYMTEFFPFCLADKSTAVRRKVWSTLFVIAGHI